jgi:hypothetical protein
VVNVIKQQPTSGHVFAFCNRTRNRVKCLHWDGSGLWVSAKRIESGFLAHMLVSKYVVPYYRQQRIVKSGAGEKALALVKEINELYAIETEVKERGYTPAQRSFYRYAKCRPVFKRLKARFEELKRGELPSSHLGDAATYALNRWPELARYAKPGYGHVNIDQNPVEGDIQPTKIGAKNWMHIGHPKAG